MTAHGTAPAATRAPGLLVSVRSADEATIALAAGVDVLDVKEPEHGPLGACAPAVLSAIVARRDAAEGVLTAISVALGDAPGLPGTFALAAAAAADRGADYVKVGLRLRDRRAALRLVRAVVEAASGGTRRARVVVAAYADADFGGLDPEALPAIAAETGAGGCLIDTGAKDGRGLLDHATTALLEAFVRACRERRLLCALAGSLVVPDLPRIAALGPDLIGARGTVCEGGRTGRLDPGRLAAFQRALRAAAAAPAEAG